MAGGSGQDFGDPASVHQLADAARQAASDLEKLIDAVRHDVRATVPDLWGGDTASTFQQTMYRFLRALAGLGSPLDRYSRALTTAAETMARARQYLEDARQFADTNGLRIRPDLIVEATGADRPGLRELVESTQQQVNHARYLAEDAKSQIQRANELLNRAAEEPGAEISMILDALSRADRRARLTPRRTAKRDREAYWRREQELRLRRRERDWLRAENQRHPEYRRRVEETVGFPPSDGMYVAHHNFPVALSGRFRAVDIEPENPLWGSWVRARDHEVFTPEHLRRWREFFDTNPYATRDQAFDLARQMAKDYGYRF